MSTGWFSHAEPFAFDMGPMRYASDVWRMIGGTMPIPAVYTARAGWEMLERLGVEAIRAKSLRQTTLLRDAGGGARLHGEHARARRRRAAGPSASTSRAPRRSRRELSARKFFHDYRPKCGLRVSPHYYTTDDEIERVPRGARQVRTSGDGAKGGGAAY